MFQYSAGELVALSVFHLLPRKTLGIATRIHTYISIGTKLYPMTIRRRPLFQALIGCVILVAPRSSWADAGYFIQYSGLETTLATGTLGSLGQACIALDLSGNVYLRTYSGQ
jgi:hypothetical protein